MSAPLSTPFVFTRHWLAGTDYVFAAKGDVLPIHRHAAEAATHLTIVTSGVLMVHGKQEGRLLNAGQIVAWPVDEDHGLEALVDGSRAVNLRMAMISEIDPEFRNGGERPLPLPSWISEAIRAHSS